MAEVTAAMIKALREKTDAPMMECKKALSESQGDMAKAEEIIRVKLGTKASKAASRVAAEGLISTFVSADQKQASLVEINSETDFVAKNDDFVAFTQNVAELVISKKIATDDLTTLAASPLADGSVESVRTALVGRIGENIAVRRFINMQAKGKLVSYIHSGKIGVLVDYEGSDAIAKDVALHIAASRPKALDESGVNPADIEVERSVALAKARESGKSEEITQKMVEGAVAKFLKEVSLLSQPFVKSDEGISIAKLLSSNNTKIHQFAIFVVGEGIEKETTDFAAEVAAQAAAAR